MNPSHGTGERYGYELGFSFKLGEESRQAQAFARVEAELVEAVLEVLLATTYGPELGVGVTSNGE